MRALWPLRLATLPGWMEHDDPQKLASESIRTKYANVWDVGLIRQDNAWNKSVQDYSRRALKDHDDKRGTFGVYSCAIPGTPTCGLMRAGCPTPSCFESCPAVWTRLFYWHMCTSPKWIVGSSSHRRITFLERSLWHFPPKVEDKELRWDQHGIYEFDMHDPEDGPKGGSKAVGFYKRQDVEWGFSRCWWSVALLWRRFLFFLAWHMHIWRCGLILIVNSSFALKSSYV